MSALEVVSVVDAEALRDLLKRIESRQAANKPADRLNAKLEKQLERALERAHRRQATVPQASVNESLPIGEREAEIAKLINAHQVVILAGETGSGKTTQLPKICLRLGRGIRGKIGHTQPRRIAASSVASRIAEELGSPLGEAVGFQVRFEDRSGPDTFIKVMTDGILLNEIQFDPMLREYDTLIIDEAHERSLNIDFLLGYLKRLLPKRPDLKLIVTSATIDLERFSKHFGGAPVLEVSGRTYPVDTYYRPWQDLAEGIPEAIVTTVDDILKHYPRGDILVFLSGEREIRETALALRRAEFRHLDIMPLYARLSARDQARVFQAHRGTRVVLATNVAETSLTVPGIKYVVDPGYARISRYSVRTKVQQLPVEAISQASANQRKGRCGRVSEGVCFRLYSEEDFVSRPEFTDAEIRRTNLAAVILQMLAMRLGDVRDFPFVDAPEHRQISDGFKLLEELRAVDSRGHITSLGKTLSQLPVDPRLAAVLFESAKLNCLESILVIASGLSVQDPRERPADKRQAADEKHRRFWDEQSDFVAYLNLWEYVEESRQALSQNQFRKQCQREFIHYMRVREWRDIHRQLRLACKAAGLQSKDHELNYEAVHRALLSGYLTLLGSRDLESKQREYFGTRNKKFTVFPGSSQCKKKHAWIVAAEFIETSQLFAHTVAKVEPQWVMDYARHLCKYRHSEPHYDVKAGQVRVYRRATLFGLVLEDRRRVAYKKVDPLDASNIFVRQALVEGKYRGKGAFFKKNQQLIASIEELEAKSRRRDILIDEEAVYRFYRDRIPEDISDVRSFDAWLKSATEKTRDSLVLTREQLILKSVDEINGEQFPSDLQAGDYRLPLKYVFEPGRAQDGVNVTVPIDVLHAVQEEFFEYLVPGLLKEKCVALVKSLPKAKRKHFVPVPEYVDRVIPRLIPRKQVLVSQLSDRLNELVETELVESDFSEKDVDDFYRMNICVVDDRGKIIDQSRDMAALREKYRQRVQKTLASAGDHFERDEIETWDFGELSEAIELKRRNLKIKAYPSLKIDKGVIQLKALDNPLEARYHSRQGVLALAYKACHAAVKYLKKDLLKGRDLGLSVMSLGQRDEVVDDIIFAAIGAAAFDGKPLPKNEREFAARVAEAKSGLVSHAQRLEKQLAACIASVVNTQKQIKSAPNPLLLATVAHDIQHQMQQLVFPGFLRKTPDQWLQQFPRYFKAIEARLEKAGQQLGKDRAHTELLSDLWSQHAARLQSEGDWAYYDNPDWQQFRWMLEELRVSLFAQQLKTLMPVSEKRLRRQWQASLSGK